HAEQKQKVVGYDGQFEEKNCISDVEQFTDDHHQIVGARQLQQVVKGIGLSVRAVRKPVREIVAEQQLRVRGIEDVPEIAGVDAGRNPAQEPEINRRVANQGRHKNQTPLREVCYGLVGKQAFSRSTPALSRSIG